MKKKIITIVGARPQIIKSSAISRAISGIFSDKLEEAIVHTGQHYDENMSGVFFDELKIPLPNYNLDVGSDSHGRQTAKMLEGLEKIFLAESPDAVLLYGDTNSTIAGALAAAKIHIPVIHVEAGLRSFDKSMPEELNRISCDHMSTLLFTPTEAGLNNLAKEGFNLETTSMATINKPHVYHCGDIMYDNSLHFSSLSEQQSSILEDLKLEENKFVLCTIHRDSNTDVKQNLEDIFKAVLEIAENNRIKIVLPLHPRTKNKMQILLSGSLQKTIASCQWISIIPPASFLDIIALEKNAKLIITDSGGLQKESFFFEKPCVILRQQTEWIELVENGNAIIADADYDRIVGAYNILDGRNDYTFPAFFGNGKAAEFICEKIVEQI